ncbi:hypothetical protein M9H77_33974 [Catharanthus roseus]|uniref:Uncharacterized protein n=1 Tax=Catharanthus roseus TaxID=4058 RepID=A0ACB9ZLL0_CATRO|nr:hypothetical protein M9H77_33974 [Catharanthus roseus]
MDKFGCHNDRYAEKMVTESKLLKHANEVYTIGAYWLFEEQFMKLSEYCQGLVAIPDKYILKRWTKDIDLSLGSSNVGDLGKVSKKNIGGYSAWRREILRKFSNLIFASELNINALEYVEEGFRMMKDKSASEVGPYYVDNLENEVGSSNSKDLVGRHAKGERNIRKKSIVEKKCNQARAKRKRVLTHASRIKTVVQLSMNNEVFGSECKISLGTSNYVFVIQTYQHHHGPLIAEHHHGPLLVVLLVLTIESIPERSFLKMQCCHPSNLSLGSLVSPQVCISSYQDRRAAQCKFTPIPEMRTWYISPSSPLQRPCTPQPQLLHVVPNTKLVQFFVTMRITNILKQQSKKS